MSSLSDLAEVIGFFSYSRDDDESYKGRLSALREAVQHELGAQLGRSKKNFRLWQDHEAIAPGKLWEAEIKTAVEQSVFFIPIVTPRAVNSQFCHYEFEAFLARERALGRNDLVFPILYVPVPALEDETRWRDHPVLAAIAKRQYVDWQAFRYADAPTPAMREEIARFARNIVEALNAQWVSPEDRRRREEAETQERAEGQRRQLEAEDRRRSEERAEADRRTQEETRRRQAEAEARQRADDERRAREAETERRAAEQRALAGARRADTVAAIDEFLRAYPASQLGAEADALRKKLLEREQAYEAAMNSNDAAEVRAFLKRFPSGTVAENVRGRLSRIEPGPLEQTSRRAVVVAGVAAIGVAGIASAVVMTRRTPAPPENGPAPNVGPPASASRLLHVLSGSTQPVEFASFSRDGGRILTQSNGGIADTRLWAVSSGALVANIPPEAGTSAAFGPDGSRIIVWDYFNGSGQVQLWNAQSGSLVARLSGHTKKLSGARFSPDGSLIVTASDDQTARIWDGRTGRLIVVLRHSAAVTSVSFSADGKWIVTTSADGVARVWTKTGSLLTTLSINASAQNARIDAIFNPDGDLVLTTLDKLAQLWKASISSGKPIATLSNSPTGFETPRFNSDGSRILTVVEDTVRLWDGRTGAPVATMSSHTGSVRMYYFNRDGSRIVTVGGMDDFRPRLWDGKNGALVAALSDHTDNVFVNFGPDGATGWTNSWDKTTSLWNAQTGAAVATVTNATVPNYEAFRSDVGRMVTVVLSADPKLRSFDAYTSTAQLVDTRTGTMFATLSGHTDRISQAAFSPDGRLVVTASKDKTARIWDATNAG